MLHRQPRHRSASTSRSSAEVGALQVARAITVFGYPGCGLVRRRSSTSRTRPTTSTSVIAQLYVRQAIAHLIDQPAIITGIYKGAGGAGLRSGAVGAADAVHAGGRGQHRRTRTTRATAVALLKAHGWNVVPGGQTTCAKAGHREPTSAAPASRRARRSRSSGPTARRRPRPPSASSPRRSPPRPSRRPGSTSSSDRRRSTILIANYNDADPVGRQVRQRLGRRQLRRLQRRLLPDPGRHLQHRRRASTSATTATRRRTALINAVGVRQQPERRRRTRRRT